MQSLLAERSELPLQRFRWLLPFLSFALGASSYRLVHDGQWLARPIALLVLGGWIWLFIQPLAPRSLRQFAGKSGAGPGTQAVQQAILFFSLPFLLLATTPTDSGQMLVTAGVMLAAIASTVHPFYRRYIASRQLPGLAFHSLCSFIAALIVLPIAVKVPVELGFDVAIVFVLLWLIVAAPLNRHHEEFSLRVLVLALCFPLAACALRAHIPAAGIHVDETVLTSKVVGHEPQDELSVVDPAALAQGLYVHASISAPLGLSQQVIFNWRHGDYAERIASTIIGGREEGYRTYSFKKHFMADAMGTWMVDIMTPQGQLLGRVEFEVDAPVHAAGRSRGEGRQLVLQHP